MWIRHFFLGLVLLSYFAVFGFANEDKPKSVVGHAANFLGIPGVDFPVFDVVPATGFKCQSPGYFSDVEARCQVFHICQADGRYDSFLCPNGTLFNQKYLVCDWWYNVDCSGAPGLYSRNEELYPKDPKADFSNAEKRVLPTATARWLEKSESVPKSDKKYGTKRVSVNRMGGALDAGVSVFAAVATSDSDEITTILPLAGELPDELPIELIEDPGVSVATEVTAEDATAPTEPKEQVNTEPSVTEAPRPSTYSRKAQSFIALSHGAQSAEVALVTDAVTTSTQVSPIDSPVTETLSTTEQYSSSASPDDQNGIAPSSKHSNKPSESPALVYIQVLSDKSSDIEHNNLKLNSSQVDNQGHLSVSATANSSIKSVDFQDESKDHPFKTGGVKHLKDFKPKSRDYGSRIGKKTKSLL